MATSTFEKTITLGQEAAERLANILEQPENPETGGDMAFWEENERNVKEWLSRLKN